MDAAYEVFAALLGTGCQIRRTTPRPDFVRRVHRNAPAAAIPLPEIAAGAESPRAAAARRPRAIDLERRPVNKIEDIKAERDGIDVLDDLQRYAREGWEAITEDDKERLKWYGLFFRKHTPGHFMLRVRFANGIATTRAVPRPGRPSRPSTARASSTSPPASRFSSAGSRIERGARHLARAWTAVGLHSRQTGMDNVRGVVRLPAGRAHAHELLDASPRSPRRSPTRFVDNGVHQPAAQVQRDDHRLPGELLPRRDAGHRPGAGLPRTGRRSGQRLQRAASAASRARAATTPRSRSTCSCGPRRRPTSARRSRSSSATTARAAAAARRGWRSFSTSGAPCASAPSWRRGSDARSFPPGTTCASRHSTDHLGIVAAATAPGLLQRAGCWCPWAASPRRSSTS